jgi:hypothetical protein
LDGEGNPINKRNAWQTRSLLYVRLIPPGAADTVHFRLPIPNNVEGPLTLEARLNYRKFSDYFTKYAFAGVAQPGRAGLDFDSRTYTSIPSRSRICRSSRWLRLKPQSPWDNPGGSHFRAGWTAKGGMTGGSDCCCKAI